MTKDQLPRLLLTGLLLLSTNAWSQDMLTLHTRSRTAGPDGADKIVEKEAAWDPKKTAVVVIDMWDDHWCKSAAARVGELTGPVNDTLNTLRGKGVFIIHAPSSVTSFYKEAPERKKAQAAPFAATPVPLSKVERWGTAWLYPDPKREGELPIDDSDMGCDCKDGKCKIREAWTRQTAALKIDPADAITDDGQEAWNLLAERKIDNVIILGVHLNMCVLGRPPAIRQMVGLGKNVVLVRDLTDTMYNPEKKPFVSHFAGTDLVVAHVERYWCPSITSTDLTGKPAFKFKAAKQE